MWAQGWCGAVVWRGKKFGIENRAPLIFGRKTLGTHARTRYQSQIVRSITASWAPASLDPRVRKANCSICTKVLELLFYFVHSPSEFDLD